MRKFITLLLIAVLLLAAAPDTLAADNRDIEGKELDTILAEYMEAHGLNEGNFAMGWYDTVSGESWYFGADRFCVAGSMYKLPLCMAILDRVEDGSIAPDAVLEGYDLERAIELTILYSSNDTADALRHRLSYDHYTYRNMLAVYSGLDTETFPYTYYSDNCISPRFMIHTLQYLYQHADQYDRLIQLMLEAEPERFFRSVPTAYPIAHKFGFYNVDEYTSVMNDCAIVYTPRPFLLTVFLQNVPESEQRLGELCSLLTDYALQLEAQESRATPMPSPIPTAAPAPTPTPAPTITALPESVEAQNSPSLWWIVPCLLLCVGMLLAVGIYFRRRKAKLHRDVAQSKEE